MCPECGSNDIIIQPYDYGICRETGYHDVGEDFQCRACGAKGDVSEIVSDDTGDPEKNVRTFFRRDISL